jgi:hypothetical protein
MAHIDEWAQIELDWAALLKREGLDSFHMYDLEHGVGQCDQWSRARRDMVIRDFREILRASNVIGIGSVVYTADWASVAPGTWLDEKLVSPSLLAFEHTIQQVLHWVEQAAIQADVVEKVDMFFDRREQEAVQGLVQAGAYGENEPWASWIKGVHFVKMKDTIPLQAADMLAYETYRLANDRNKDVGEPSLRAHMGALLKGVPVYGQYYDAEALKILGAQVVANERPDLLRPQGGVSPGRSS